MKRIVICLDGTWNKIAKPDEVTNVVKFAQSVAPEATGETRQIVYYNSGVGTGGALDRFLGGVFGAGVRNNVQRAYAFLTLNYVAGDEIYIVGFSRGAFTARALASMIGAVGVLKREEFERFDEAWNYYRVPPTRRRGSRAVRRAGAAPQDANLKESEAKAVHAVEEADWFVPASVKALGVWDTVGSYGVPSGLLVSGLGPSITAWLLGFHDRQLGEHVEHAYHAMAIDEARGAFEPTLWLAPKGTPHRDHCEQVWFPGVHSDVGGGYDAAGLSDVALVWMMDRLSIAGLELVTTFVSDEYCPCPHCPLHRSDNLFWRVMSPYKRPTFSDRPRIVEGETEQQVINEMLHWSVVQRRKEPGGRGLVAYQPRNIPQDLQGLRVCEPGPFEVRVLESKRPHRLHAESSPHDHCWSQAIPDGFLPQASSPAA